MPVMKHVVFFDVIIVTMQLQEATENKFVILPRYSSITRFTVTWHSKRPRAHDSKSDNSIIGLI